MQNTKQKNRKLVIMTVAVMAMVLTSVATFAYWDRLQASDNDVVVAVGEGVTMNVENLGQEVEGNLIPNNDTVIVKDGDIKEAKLTYNVKLDKEFTSGVQLTVNVINLKIGDLNASSANPNADVEVATLLGLVHFDYTTTYDMVSGSATEVVITVTMDEPATEAYYNLIANKVISFDVTFEAAVA